MTDTFWTDYGKSPGIPTMKFDPSKFSMWGNGGIEANTNANTFSLNNWNNPSQTKKSWLDGFLKKTDPKTGLSSGDWGIDLLNAGSSAFNAYTGFKQLGLAEDTFDFQKEAFNKNYGAQKQLTEADFNWREKARQARDPNYQTQSINL